MNKKNIIIQSMSIKLSSSKVQRRKHLAIILKHKRNK
jgi:hypothetical protein